MGLIVWKKKLVDLGFAKPIGTTFVVTSLGWLLYEVYATANTLKTIGHIGICNHGVKYIHVEENVTKGLTIGRDGHLEQQLGRRRLISWLHHTRVWRMWRLLHLAQTGDHQTRTLAVQKLASLQHNLTVQGVMCNVLVLMPPESDILQLAQAYDAHTAVGLARSRSLRRGSFLPPPLIINGTNTEELVILMRNILHKMNQERGHLCVKFFLTKAFPDFEKQNNCLLDAELMVTEPWTVLTSPGNLLPMCVQALDHQVATLHHEKFFVNHNGLPILMAVYNSLKDDPDVSKMICRVLTRICSHTEFLPEIFSSGWVGVLEQWLFGDEPQLSLMAGQSLANLDRDDSSRANYGRHIVPLFPNFRSHSDPSVDVIFVHGLLGGVISTWRQRDARINSLLGLQKEELVDSRRHHTSDEFTEEYLAAMTALSNEEWDQLGADYEFVLSDFPVDSKEYSSQLYTLSGSDRRVRQDGLRDSSNTVCWPRDWLPKDCPHIRVLGIDYDSRISDWFPTCSEKYKVKTLEERSLIVLEELRRCGIGKRPTVWVAHSMGGLLVKKMLTEALSSCNFQIRRIAHNSRAVLFLSTPHLGCPLAKMNDVLNYFLWPSSEVEELKHNSEVLNTLHERFNELLEHVNIRVVTFAEAKSTKIAGLGVDIHIVPPEFSHFDVGDVYEMPCDHACVAKPYNRLSFTYQTVLRVIKKVQEEILQPQPSVEGKSEPILPKKNV